MNSSRFAEQLLFNKIMRPDNDNIRTGAVEETSRTQSDSQNGSEEVVLLLLCLYLCTLGRISFFFHVNHISIPNEFFYVL